MGCAPTIYHTLMQGCSWDLILPYSNILRVCRCIYTIVTRFFSAKFLNVYVLGLLFWQTLLLVRNSIASLSNS